MCDPYAYYSDFVENPFSILYISDRHLVFWCSIGLPMKLFLDINDLRAVVIRLLLFCLDYVKIGYNKSPLTCVYCRPTVSSGQIFLWVKKLST
mgnify:CR=1 FL=1